MSADISEDSLETERRKEAELEALLARMAEVSEESVACKASPPPPDETGWGVPDWRDPSAYPDHREIDLSAWRWEFLRRNHGYRLDWCRDDDDFGVSRERYLEDVYDLRWPVDPRSSARSIVEDLERGDEDGLWAMEPQKPPKSLDGAVMFNAEDLRQRYAEFREIKRIIPPNPTYLDRFIRIDLRRPLRPQFEAFLRAFRRRQNQLVRKQPRCWPLYLRILDARDAGVSYTKLSRELPDEPSQHAPGG